MWVAHPSDHFGLVYVRLSYVRAVVWWCGAVDGVSQGGVEHVGRVSPVFLSPRKTFTRNQTTVPMECVV